MRQWLTETRVRQGFKQKDIAQYAQISAASYCLIESGNRRPSVEVAKRIASALGFDWTRFFEE